MKKIILIAVMLVLAFVEARALHTAPPVSSGAVPELPAGLAKKYSYSIEFSHNTANRFSIRMSGSRNSVDYILQRGNETVKTIKGTGGPLVFDNLSVAGTYKIITSSYTVCEDIVVEMPKSYMGDSVRGNWIRSYTYTEGSKTEDINYFDGLGYPIQTVSRQASPNGYDMVQAVHYDNMRRSDSKTYLPFTTTNTTGDIINRPLASSKYVDQYGSKESAYAFSELIRDNSPSARPSEVYNVGRIYRDSGRSTKYTYETNQTGEVSNFIHSIANNSITRSGFYQKGILQKTTSVNEDGNILIEYKDGSGKVIMTRNVIADNDYADTYYIYDDLDRLAWVISPEGNSLFLDGRTFYNYSNLTTRYCYVYIYNNVGNVIEKQLPGADHVYMVYDKADRLVMTQDGNLRSNNSWIRNIYDALGRNTKTELLKFQNANRTRATLQSSYGSSLTPLIFSDATSSTLNEYYYDNYQALSDLGSESAYGAVEVCNNAFLYVRMESDFSFDASSLNGIADYEYIRLYKGYWTCASGFCIVKDLEDDDGNYFGYYYIPKTHLSGLQQVLAQNPGAQSLRIINAFPGNGERASFAMVGRNLEGLMDFAYPTSLGSGVSYNNRMSGFKTFEKTAVIDGGVVTNDFIYRVHYYDYKGRVIQTVEKNHINGISRYSTKYDFVGNVLASHESHSGENHTPDMKLTEYTYDKRNRLLTEATGLNSSYGTSIKYEYDEAGRLKSKSYGGPTFRDVSHEVPVETGYWLAHFNTYDNSLFMGIMNPYLLNKYGSNYSDYGGTDYFNGNSINPAYFISRHKTNPYIDYYYIPCAEQFAKEDIKEVLDRWRATSPTSDLVPYEICSLHPNSSIPFPTSNPLTSVKVDYLGMGEDLYAENFDYNIQGWLTEKTSNYFDMALRYYDKKPGSNISYTGNITEWEWKHKGADVPDAEVSPLPAPDVISYPDPPSLDPYTVVPVRTDSVFLRWTMNFSQVPLTLVNKYPNFFISYSGSSSIYPRGEYEVHQDHTQYYIQADAPDLFEYIKANATVVPLEPNNSYGPVDEVYIRNESVPEITAPVPARPTTTNPYAFIPVFTDRFICLSEDIDLNTDPLRDVRYGSRIGEDGLYNDNYKSYFEHGKSGNPIRDEYRFTIYDGTTEHTFYYIPKHLPGLRNISQGYYEEGKALAVINAEDLPGGDPHVSPMLAIGTTNTSDPYKVIPVMPDVLTTILTRLPEWYADDYPYYMTSDVRYQFRMKYDTTYKYYIPATDPQQSLYWHLYSAGKVVNNEYAASFGAVSEVYVTNPNYLPLVDDVTNLNPYTYIPVYTDRFLYSPTGEPLTARDLRDPFTDYTIYDDSYPSGVKAAYLAEDGVHIKDMYRFTVNDGETEHVYYYIPKNLPQLRRVLHHAGSLDKQPAWVERDDLPAGTTVTPFLAVENPDYDVPALPSKANQSNAYLFTYDKAGRLTDTRHYAPDGTWDRFTERGIGYDRNGNIQKLKRYSGGKLVDNLQYTYEGNRLTSLAELAEPFGAVLEDWDVYARGASEVGTYAYDPNGNMNSDQRNGLNFKYNFLNLLGEARNASTNGLITKYKYLADGTKVGAVNGTGDVRFEYLGSLVYKRNADSSLELESASFGGGRIKKISDGYAGYERHYFITDHLGSTRVVVSDKDGYSRDWEIAERSDYYPFGARHRTPDAAIADNRYRFSGKEDQESLGLPFQDFGARMYDGPLGRWWSLDPLAKKYYPISPYAYVGNNPVRRVDPDGKEWVDAKNNKMWANGGYTDHATPEFRRGGDAMRATETGRAAFDNVANSSASISYTISPATVQRTSNNQTELIRGEFVPGPDQPVNSEGNVELRDGAIIIYEGSIKAEIDGSIQIGGETHGLIMALPADQALEGAIGATSVHEGLHTTPENVQMAYENNRARKNGQSEPPHSRENIEKEPKEKQNQHLRELLGQ